METVKARQADLNRALMGMLAETPGIRKFTDFSVDPQQAESLQPDEVEAMRLYATIRAEAQRKAQLLKRGY